MGIKTYNPYTPSRRHMTGSDSVSYTHLDVYKRQGWRRASTMAVQSLRSGLGQGSFRHSQATSATVSYTHLDVYKRQAFAEDLAATAAAGMNAHISKPIDFRLLCRTLAELPDGRQTGGGGHE